MSTRVTTPEAILSYPHLDKAQPGMNGGKAKFSATLIFPKGTDLTALQAAAVEAATTKFGAQLKLPGNKTMPIAEAMAKGIIRSPFRTDGEAKGYPEGSTFINVRTEQQPGCVYPHAGPDGKPAKVEAGDVRAVFYPGCKVRASLAAFGYDTSGNKGASFALNNIQKLGEGERLDGRVAAENEFDATMSEAPADLESLMGK